MTVSEALKRGETLLQQAGIEEYRNDAWLLFSYITGFDRTEYFMRGNDVLTPDDETGFQALLQRRASREPVQYIMGKACFMGYDFLVNENVLIPRQDTEILVENVLKLVKKGDRILDLCTGSGCILLSVLSESGAAEGIGSDLSEKALAVAAKNAARLGVKHAHFVQSDLFKNIKGVFDLIVSNPPYIKTDVIAVLMEEVRSHEPYMALDGHEDGLFFYRRITEEAAGFLKSGGYLCYEIGCEQGFAVRQLMEKQGFEDIRIIKDLAMLDRVVIGRRR